MKTLFALGPLAALSAFSVAIFSFEAPTSLLIGVGFFAIVLTDDALQSRPPMAEMSSAGVTAQGREYFRPAA